MIKGICSKFETLSDGSCKLSIYVPIESMLDAARLNNQSVNITLATGKETRKDEVISAVKRAAEAILEAIGQEMNVSISEYPEPEQ